ncbi:unnamed protein product [marine sediment metagenome]|uniref:Transcriptional coactivator p15 (PC4) C-terminal domain-containing protein n=1 Tax=marine sediment metagenome TaxID=412755 RepID=X1P9V5_9ZZZZ
MTKEENQKEIGRIELSDTQELVVSIVDDEKLDLRIFVKTDSYTGPTKRGLRIYLFDGIWEKFKKLIEQVDKVYEEIG